MKKFVFSVAFRATGSLQIKPSGSGDENVQDVTSVDLPSSGEREHSKQSLSFLCPFYLV